jgi:hypothetical protein
MYCSVQQNEQQPSNVPTMQQALAPAPIDASNERMTTSLSMDAEGEGDRSLHAESGNADHTAITQESVFPSSLLSFVPETNPRHWVWINNSLAISGCILVLDLTYARVELSERPFANGFYLLWEFSTCFFWTIESSLSATYQRYHLHVPLKWSTKFEIAIAGYFLASTAWIILEWNINKDKGQEGIWEIALDASFYVYLAIKGCRRTESAATPESVEDIPSYQMMNSSVEGVLM